LESFLGVVWVTINSILILKMKLNPKKFAANRGIHPPIPPSLKDQIIKSSIAAEHRPYVGVEDLKVVGHSAIVHAHDPGAAAIALILSTGPLVACVEIHIFKWMPIRKARAGPMGIMQA
jgi:hypothetical protein